MQQADDIIPGYLRAHIELIGRVNETSHPRPQPHFEQYLLNFAEHQPWREVDTSIYPYGEAGQCYRESAHLALKDPKLTYVEGMAINFGVFPVAHGWCVDEDGFVVDVTWRPRPDLEKGRPMRREYFGVVIDEMRLRELLVTHKWYGVLPFLIQEELALDGPPRRDHL